MGMNFSYSAVVPDIGGFDQATDTNPGYLVELGESDGLVALVVRPANQQNTLSSEGVYGAVLNPQEAEELLHSLQEAIDLARERVRQGSGTGHPNRVRRR